MDFCIYGGSWNQSPMDTERGLYGFRTSCLLPKTKLDLCLLPYAKISYKQIKGKIV